MIGKLLKGFTRKQQDDLSLQLHRKLIRREAELGGQLFGEIPHNRRREFFCLDEHTWVWHEEWTDKKGQRHINTVRYDMRPSGVLKSQNGHEYQSLSHDELQNLKHAISQYKEKVAMKLYPEVVTA